MPLEVLLGYLDSSYYTKMEISTQINPISQEEHSEHR